jgi:hypothetical protein
MGKCVVSSNRDHVEAVGFAARTWLAFEHSGRPTKLSGGRLSPLLRRSRSLMARWNTPTGECLVMLLAATIALSNVRSDDKHNNNAAVDDPRRLPRVTPAVRYPTTESSRHTLQRIGGGSS